MPAVTRGKALRIAAAVPASVDAMHALASSLDDGAPAGRIHNVVVVYPFDFDIDTKQLETLCARRVDGKPGTVFVLRFSGNYNISLITFAHRVVCVGAHSVEDASAAFGWFYHCVLYQLRVQDE